MQLFKNLFLFKEKNMGRRGRKYLTTRTETWDSGLSILEPTIILHPEIELILGSVQDDVKSNEFSMLFKGKWNGEGFYVSNDYKIPLQEVGSCSVDYKEDISKYREEGFNVITHSHPFSASRNGGFSRADEEHVNSHFPCSLLSNSEGEVIAGSLLVDLKDDSKLTVSIPLKDIKVEVVNTTIEVEGIDNIKEERTTRSICGYPYNAGYNENEYEYDYDWNKDKDKKKNKGVTVYTRFSKKRGEPMVFSSLKAYNKWYAKMTKEEDKEREKTIVKLLGKKEPYLIEQGSDKEKPLGKHNE